jgi:C1A family cysteine protease
MEVQLSALIPDPLDERDFMFEYDPTLIVPPAHSLRDHCSNMEDQLTVGSCTANATCSNAEMFLMAGNKFADESRLFVYKKSRSYLPPEFQNADMGSTLRDSLRAARNFGIPRESIWPYDPTQWNTEPSPEAYADALNFKAEGYYRINGQDENILVTIKQALAKGYPVLLSMHIGEMMRHLKPSEVYDYIQLPSNPHWGGHALLIVGYDEGAFIVQNSWGSGWCDGGFFRCSFDAVWRNNIDMWVLKGFAGVERLGEDVTKKPEPIPAPPSPVPTPIEASKPPYTIYTILCVVVLVVATKLMGIW